MKAIGLMFAMMLAGAAVAQPAPEAVKSYGPDDAGRRLLVRGTTDIARFETVMDLSRPAAAIRVSITSNGGRTTCFR